MKKEKENSLIEEFGGEKIWINYQLKHRGADEGAPLYNPDGKPKMTKIPINPYTGGFASVSDPTTWTDYESAKGNLGAAGGVSGIGIVFTGLSIIKEGGEEIVGIDLDRYLDISGKITDDRVMDFYIQSETFASISQSGTGLHFYFATEEAGKPISFVPSQNKKTGAFPFEIYSSKDSNGVSKGRYFAETGRVFGEDKPIRHLSIQELVDLLKILGYEEKGEEKEKIIEEPSSYSFDSDEDLLKAMFGSKNGAKIESVYNGDASKWKGDLSSADESLCSSLAFWTGRDKETMRRIWVSSPLGKREKTQKRVDYQNSTLDYAIKHCTEVYKRGGEEWEGEDGEDNGKWIMSTGKNPRPLFSGAGGVTNIFRLLERDEKYAGKIRRNEFSHQPEFLNSSGKWQDLSEEFVNNFMNEISEPYPMFSQVAENTVVMAIMTVADKHPVNPPADWVRSLIWDRVSRLDNWLYKTYGCPDDLIHQQMGAFFLIGMMSRILTPGRQFDSCLCLISGQGKKKSSSLRVLGQSPDPDVSWHVEHTGGIEDKDFGMIMAKNILVEFSEGSVNSKTDIKTVKSIISKQEDQFRLPYGKVVSTFKRGCSFALTTNDPQFLRDDTGNRRYLIVKFDQTADLTWLSTNRDQLFAEAAYRLTVEKEKFWWDIEETKELEELQAASTAGNIYDEDIVQWYSNLDPAKRAEGILPINCFNDLFNTDAEHPREVSYGMESKILSTFRRLLFLEKKSTRLHIQGKGEVASRWLPTEKTFSHIDLSNEKERPKKGSLDEFVEESEEGKED